MGVSKGVFKTVLGSLAAIVIAGCLASVFGQSATGTLTGTVTDQKGLAMVGVSVVIHNVATGVDLPPVMTNDQGVYNVPALQPGNYDITVSQPGFSTLKRSAVPVQVGSTVRIDFEMPVSATQTLVTVTTEIPLLETEKTEHSQNVTENLVTNLPISSRRWEQFVLLTPGVSPDGANGQVSFHGLNSGYNNNSVDGANNNSNYNNSARGGTNDGYVYSGDSIREFQVASSGFNAEKGQAAGGAVNAVTKSGTNAWHGDLFYNGRAANFNALDPAGKADAAVKGVKPTQSIHQQHQYGGSVGGPLLKDRLFFFTTIDAYRKVTPIAYISDNPPVAAAPWCPAAITALQCSTAINFLNNQNLGIYPRLLRQDVELVKLDYQLNQSNHLSVTANIRDWKQPNGTAFATSSNSGVTTAGTNYIQDRFFIANWTAVISSSMVNEFRYQWGEDNNFNPRTGGQAPQFQLQNVSTYGNNNGSTFTDETRHQFSDDFSLTRGSHAFKMGIDINWIRDVARSATNSAALYSYNGYTATVGSGSSAVSGTRCLASATTAQKTVCSWLLDIYGIDDIVTSGTTTVNFKGTHFNTFSQIKDEVANVPPETYRYDFYDHDIDFYFQDTWKFRPNITVNFGVRYGLQLLPQPPFSATSVYGSGIATTLPLLARYTSTIPIDHSAIQPRFGLAWNFAPKSVFRFGGGIFYGKTSGSAFKTIISGAGESNINCTPAQARGTTGVCAGLRAPNALYDQQDTDLYQPFSAPGLVTPTALNPTAAPCPSPTCGIRGIDPEAQRPRAYNAEVAIEQQVPGNLNVSVSYIFTRGVKLPAHFDANIARNTLTKTYDVVDANGVTQLATAVPFFTQRLNPGTGPIIAEFSEVNSMYHGLVVTVRKPMSHGIEFLGNYTLSRAVDNGQAGVGIGGITFQSTDGIIDMYNLNGEQGFSSTDVRNRFTGSIIWQPNWGAGSSGIRKFVVQGWSVSSAITATNGARYSGTVQSSSTQCAVVASPCPTGSSGLNGGMNGALIQTTGNNIGGRITWLPRNSIVLPNLYNVDLRVSKRFAITERMAFELRIEAFNLFNSTLVLAASSNAYNYAQPGAAGCVGHTNTCMVPVSSFQRPSTTSGNLFGARQLQAGARFNF